MNPFNTALVKKPKWSSFPHHSSNKISWCIGDLVPVKKYFLDAGDHAQVDLGQLTRFNPLLAPVMDEYQITVDAFFVPTRILQSQVKDGVFTKFWNYSINLNNAYKLPKKKALNLLEEVNSSLPFDCPLSQSLYDYLDYPTFPNAYEVFLEFIRGYHGTSESQLLDGARLDTFPSSYSELSLLITNWRDALENGYVVGNDIDFNGFNRELVEIPTGGPRSVISNYHVIMYLLYRYYGLDIDSMDYGVEINDKPQYNVFLMELEPYVDSQLTIDWTGFFNYKKIDADSFFKSYYEFVVYGIFLEVDWRTTGNTAIIYHGLAQTLDYDDTVNDIYLRAYWRIVADWYTNLNLTGYTNDEQYCKYLYDEFAADEFDSSSDFIPVSPDSLRNNWVPFKRNWANDYFTSAFANPQSGSAVMIPNGTITDLRAASVWQWAREVVLYAGKKAVDAWRAIRGVVSSNARLDMAEPLRRVVFNVDINAITQTNQSDIDNQLKTPVASWSGQGISAGAKGFVDYTSEEPGILMILASVRPFASYIQGLSRHLTAGDSLIDDYVFPKFSKVGEQAIKSTELFFDIPLDGSNVGPATFGYTRRYAQYMFDKSEVHGEFKTSLDYWHSARKFDVQPSLGLDFVAVDTDRDNLNRVFATSNVQNVYSYFVFDARVIRALPKYLNYGL